MRNRALDLILVSALAAGAMTLTMRSPDAGVAHLFFALPLVLILPGYALTAAIFPTGALGLAERTLFSLGLSLATAALGGLALQWAPIGLAASSWAALLGNLTLAACLVALVRRARVGAPAISTGLRLESRPALMLGVAALVAGAALLVAREGALQREAGNITQLWALPARNGDALRLGVANLETRSVSYRLELASPGAVLQTWPSIALDPGERWEQVVELSATARTDDVRAVLYRLDAPQKPYRQVLYRFDDQAAGSRATVQVEAVR